jgi:hypothetical protein
MFPQREFAAPAPRAFLARRDVAGPTPGAFSPRRDVAGSAPAPPLACAGPFARPLLNSDGFPDAPTIEKTDKNAKRVRRGVNLRKARSFKVGTARRCAARSARTGVEPGRCAALVDSGASRGLLCGFSRGASPHGRNQGAVTHDCCSFARSRICSALGQRNAWIAAPDIVFLSPVVPIRCSMLMVVPSRSFTRCAFR